MNKNFLDIFKKLKKYKQSEAPEVPEKRTSLADAKQKIGWISPNYTQCRTVHLNPGFLEQNRCVALFSDMPEVDSYKILRQQILQRTWERGENTIMVTSALPGEGKTLTAINLAFAFAQKFQHTALLVDCDLKIQNIHKVLGFENNKGVVDYILGECDIPDLIVWPGIEKLTIVSGGKTIDESSEMLGSPRMKDLVKNIKEMYRDRYIIFDVPPILAGADALTFANLVDTILVVVQADQTSMSDVKKALQMMPQEKILGLVLNRSSAENITYYSQYSGKNPDGNPPEEKKMQE